MPIFAPMHQDLLDGPTMKHQLIVISLLLGSAVLDAAADDATCLELSQTFAQAYSGFPEIKAGTIEQIVSWKASCATKPPAGLGNVVALCLAALKGDGHVFYWTKAAIEAETSGYEICDY